MRHLFGSESIRSRGSWPCLRVLSLKRASVAEASSADPANVLAADFDEVGR